MSDTPAVDFRNVSLSYDGRDVLRDVSVTIDSGDFVSNRIWAAMLPSAHISFGLINLIFSARCGKHVLASSGSGSRFSGGRHLRMLAI